MKDILFKAKVKNWRELPTEEQWVYGYYVRGFNVYEEPIHIIFDPTTIFENNKTDGWDEIDPDTLCRYTGPTDKNGKKIWENDIVFVTDDDGNSGQVDTGIGEIDFFEGLWYINGRVQNSLYDINRCFQVEVLGNIFDNPELLEGGGKDE